MSLAFLVNGIPGQPIIVARPTAHFTTHHNPAFYHSFAKIAAKFRGTYYRIIDLTEVRIDQINDLHTLSQSAEGIPGSASDPRVVKNFYIGTVEQIKLVRALREQQPTLTLDMIFVESLAQALNAIYEEMEGHDS